MIENVLAVAQSITAENALEIILNRTHQIRLMCMVGFPALFFIWIFCQREARGPRAKKKGRR